MSLYRNIHAKRKRIEKGSEEKMRKKGAKGAPTDKAFKQAAKTAKKKPRRTTKKRGWLYLMWSWHTYWGFNLGFEWYEGEVDGNPVDYFLINIGPIRVQKAEWA